MQIEQLQTMTVIQLRKLAKENGVKLGAGIDKAGIVERIAEKLCAAEPAAPEAPKAEAAPQPTMESLQEASLSADVTSVSPGGSFRPWNQSESQEGGYRPAYRQAWQARSAQNEQAQKPAWQRNVAAPSRFGPQSRPAPQPQQEMQEEAPRMSAEPARQENRPAQDNAPRLDGYRLGYRAAPQRQPYQNRNDYGSRDQNYGGYQQRGNYQQNNYGYQNRGYQQNNYQQQGGYRNNYNGYQQRSFQPQQSSENNYNDGLYRMARDQQFMEQAEAGQLPDMMQVAQSEPVQGILEVLPDGYGFLRGKSLLPGKKDIYVSMAQIRRYGLRTGDHVEGKARAQREGDKFAALLYVERLNGEEAQENPDRLSFEQLVPVYPDKRIVLEGEESSMAIRLVDLIAPMGFGQRAMIVSPPESGRLTLMSEMARAIKRNDPAADVLMLLIDVAPEEVTEISESVEAEVFAYLCRCARNPDPRERNDA
ncbi:MAG: hypothetical protein J6K55_17020 [Clostridia bacterium]|nr:hypothetical protein [Clostridia bacterium]